jgi:hypothetical protein
MSDLLHGAIHGAWRRILETVARRAASAPPRPKMKKRGCHRRLADLVTTPHES